VALPNPWHSQKLWHFRPWHCKSWHCQTAHGGTAKVGELPNTSALPNCRPWHCQSWHCQTNFRGTIKSVALPKTLALQNCSQWHCKIRGTAKNFGAAKLNLVLRWITTSALKTHPMRHRTWISCTPQFSLNAYSCCEKPTFAVLKLHKQHTALVPVHLPLLWRCSHCSLEPYLLCTLHV
jgi:hypothetical protein